MFALLAIVFGVAYLAGKSTQYVTPNASMQGLAAETEDAAYDKRADTDVLSPEDYEKEKRVKAAINSRNPKAMVRLAISIEKTNPKTAKVLVARAIREEERQDKEKKIAIPSPIEGVSPVAWGKYVRVMSRSVPGGNRIGAFGMSLRRLQDIGLISSIEGNTVEWREGITPEDFEENVNLQYRAFAKSSKDHARTIRQSKDVGKMICGEPATLSGLMTVAHFAGPTAYHKWVASESDKDKFPATTQAYQHTNGLF